MVLREAPGQQGSEPRLPKLVQDLPRPTTPGSHRRKAEDEQTRCSEAHLEVHQGEQTSEAWRWQDHFAG